MSNWQVTVAIGKYVFQWRKGTLEVMEVKNFLNTYEFERDADIDYPSVNTYTDAVSWIEEVKKQHWFCFDGETGHDIITFSVLCSRYQDCQVPFKWEDVLIDGVCIEKETWY